jgi:FixJ family two-component response regulator
LVNVDVLDNMVAHQRGDDSEVQTEQAAPPGRDSLEPRDLLTNPQLIDAVQSLTPKERLVMLALIEREPPPNATQIAHALKIGSAATVRVHRASALKKLRDIFGAGDDCGEENR